MEPFVKLFPAVIEVVYFAPLMAALKEAVTRFVYSTTFKFFNIFQPLQVLTQRTLDLFGCHLQDYIRAKELVSEQQTLPAERWSSEGEQLWKVYSGFTKPHLAMTDDTVEVNYTRAVVDLLLHVLVPLPDLETNSGRFVVGELITCNVLLPFIAKLSDPDWLNGLLIEVCGNSSEPQESLTSSPPPAEPPSHSELTPLQEANGVPQQCLYNCEVPPLRADAEMVDDADTATLESAGFDVIDSAEVDCTRQSAEEEEPTRPFLRHCVRGGKSNPFYQENDSDVDSPFADYKQSSTDSLVLIGQEEAPYDRQKECATPAESNNGVDLEDVSPSPLDVSCPRVLLNSRPVEHPNCCSPSFSRTGEGTPSISTLPYLEREGCSPSVTPARELFLGVEHSPLGNLSELTEVSPLQSSSPLPSFSFEPLISPDGPVIIQNLRITGTITAKEHRGTGSHPYTLYTIKVRRRHECCLFFHRCYYRL